MTAAQAREYVNAMYSSAKWRAKVARMSDAQVIAIFLKEQNKQDKPQEPDKPDNPQLPF